MNHSELVRIGALLLKRWGWYGILTEPQARRAGGESPDVIGFKTLEGSCVIECKTSRADFLADAKKPHRMGMGASCGRYKIYLFGPDCDVRDDEVPKDWGIARAGEPDFVDLARRPPRKAGDGYWTDEKSFMMSALYRYAKAPEAFPDLEGRVRQRLNGEPFSGTWI